MGHYLRYFLLFLLLFISADSIFSLTMTRFLYILQVRRVAIFVMIKRADVNNSNKT